MIVIVRSLSRVIFVVACAHVDAITHVAMITILIDFYLPNRDVDRVSFRIAR